MRAPSTGRSDERGTAIVIISLALSVMLTFTAVVIDLSQLRADRQVNKSVADTAVRAGLSRLQAGAWSGVCRARAYLRTHARLSSFDSGSEKWLKLSSPVNTTLTTNPCSSVTSTPYTTQCRPNDPSTWGLLKATASGGRYAVEIRAGYALPDPRFAEDVLLAEDGGDPHKGSCDILAVIITERRTPLFAGVTNKADKTTTTRSVGRLGQGDTRDNTPALLLLEQHGCAVLTSTSQQARVIAQPYQSDPGVIQIDSADDQAGCSSNQAVLNGKATSGGPSIIACSARTSNPTPGCNLATADRPSRIGLYALNFAHASGDYVTSTYPDTYGDSPAMPSAQQGRTPIDEGYRTTMRDLDAAAKSVLTDNGGRPPGCAAITGSTCTGTDGEWLVLQQADCNALASFFAADPSRPNAPQIWFNCSLAVTSALTLDALRSFVVITGTLSVTSTFAVNDPEKLFVGGTSSGNKIGIDVGNGGSFNVGNPVPGASCPAALPMTKYSEVVLGDGSFTMGSSGASHLCGTFMFLASGYGKVPAVDGTAPCSSPCSGYLGTLGIGSGSSIDWTAPNLITNRRATDSDLQTISPFEDLAAWTEAGGAGNGVNGGGESRMSGVYFLGNADAFTLAGSSGANVYLSAQFIVRRLNVTGGAVVNLVLNPFDSVPYTIYELSLIR